MKTAPKWQTELAGETSVEGIAAIQRDALQHAADLVHAHRQEIFEDGLDADMEDMDGRDIFLISASQERDSIENMLRAAAKA